MKIIAIILILFWPFFVGFFGEAYKDLQIWIIQKRLNYFTQKYSNGGTVKGCFKFYKLIKKAEKFGCFISVRIDSGGNDNVSMKVTLIKLE
ncbi:MAG: hypothetical protein P4L31_07360 [Candidatus Babeliales bacterium]|nr:hypothetical protein [Candidatus Babeliales bacterium]